MDDHSAETLKEIEACFGALDNKHVMAIAKICAQVQGELKDKGIKVGQANVAIVAIASLIRSAPGYHKEMDKGDYKTPLAAIENMMQVLNMMTRDTTMFAAVRVEIDTKPKAQSEVN